MAKESYTFVRPAAVFVTIVACTFGAYLLWKQVVALRQPNPHQVAIIVRNRPEIKDNGQKVVTDEKERETNISNKLQISHNDKTNNENQHLIMKHLSCYTEAEEYCIPGMSHWKGSESSHSEILPEREASEKGSSIISPIRETSETFSEKNSSAALSETQCSADLSNGGPIEVSERECSVISPMRETSAIFSDRESSGILSDRERSLTSSMRGTSEISEIRRSVISVNSEHYVKLLEKTDPSVMSSMKEHLVMLLKREPSDALSEREHSVISSTGETSDMISDRGRSVISLMREPKEMLSLRECSLISLKRGSAEMLSEIGSAVVLSEIKCIEKYGSDTSITQVRYCGERFSREDVSCPTSGDSEIADCPFKEELTNQETGLLKHDLLDGHPLTPGDNIKLQISRSDDIQTVWNYIGRSGVGNDEDVKMLLCECGGGRRNPMHRAVQEGNSVVIEALLRLGASIDFRDRQGRFPTHIAASAGNIKLLDILFRWGVDMSKKDMLGYTPLHRAVLKGQLDTVKWLIDRGALIDDVSWAGWTPLHLAAESGNVDITEFLMNRGAEVNVKNKDGCTPLHLAKIWKKDDVIKLLEARGAGTVTDK